MTLTLAQAITVAILAVSCFFCGWFFYRLRAKAREAELNRALMDTKGVIPQLESTVRSREQRVSALINEVGDWKSRHSGVESSLKEKERELLARDRALRALNAELTLLKEARSQQPDQAAESADTGALETLQKELAEAQARCSELERSLALSRETANAAPALPQPAEAALSAASSEEFSQLRERLGALEAELGERDAANADLDARLKAEALHSAELRDTIDRQANELAREREETAKWRARVPKLAESMKDKDARLTESNQRAEDLAQSLAAARSEHRAAADELAALRQSHTEANTQLDALRASLDALRIRDEGLTRERDELTNRVTAAETSKAAVETDLAAKVRELASLKAELDSAERNVKQARDDFARKLATSIKLGREEVDRLNQESDRLTHELGAAIAARNDAVEAHAALEASARSNAAEIDALRVERDAAMAARSTLESEHAALRERNAGIAEECTRLERRVGELEGDLTEALERLTQIDASRSEAHAEQAGLAEQLASRDAQLELLEHELSAQQEELRVWNARVAPLESLIKQRDVTLAARTTRIEELQAQVARLETELTERSQRASQRERELLAANAGAKESKPDPKSEYLETRIANQFEKNRELVAALEERNKAVAALEKDRDLKDKSMTVLRQQLEQEREATDRLAGQLRALRERVPETPPEQPDDSIEPKKPKDLFSSPPQDKDDLQQIRGIGAAFEHRLNVLGVYQYRQIAGFSDAELVWLENEMKTFRGRIGRDDWVGQAVALMALPPSTSLVLASSQSL